MEQIKNIYHSHNGADAYRAMTVYLARRGYNYGPAAIHKDMNTESALHSIVRPKKPDYEHGKPHRVFENKPNQDFTADKVNQKGSRYTSEAFVEFCGSVDVAQSMGKAGNPYDNAPMERYFNTLKNECINLYEFRTEEALYQAVEEFAYVSYNHVRPHSFNGYRTPCQARITS